MASNKKFEVAQLVLIYISAEGEPLKPKLHGSYEILQKLSPVNFLINTLDRRKKTFTPYRMHPDKIKILRKDIDTLLELGIIRQSPSCYASPSMLLDKPNGGVRLVIDFSLLNKNCYCQAHPIPWIDDLIDKVGQAKFLTKLDLTKAY